MEKNLVNTIRTYCLITWKNIQKVGTTHFGVGFRHFEPYADSLLRPHTWA